MVIMKGLSKRIFQILKVIILREMVAGGTQMDTIG